MNGSLDRCMQQSIPQVWLLGGFASLLLRVTDQLITATSTSDRLHL